MYLNIEFWIFSRRNNHMQGSRDHWAAFPMVYFFHAHGIRSGEIR